MRFRIRIFAYLAIGTLALVCLFIWDEIQTKSRVSKIKIKVQNFESDNVQKLVASKVKGSHVTRLSMSPKRSAPEMKSTVKKVVLSLPKIQTTKSTTESVEQEAVIKAMFGPDMTKRKLEEMDGLLEKKSVENEPSQQKLDSNPKQSLMLYEQQRNILVLTQDKKSIVTSMLMFYPYHLALIFHQENEETTTDLAENLLKCDITANNKTMDFYTKMDKSWSLQYERYCYNKTKLSVKECHLPSHFKALCPYFPIKIFKLNQQVKIAKTLLKKNIPNVKLILEVSDPRRTLVCQDEKYKKYCQNHCNNLADNVKEALKLGEENRTNIFLVRNEDAVLAPDAMAMVVTRFLNLGLRHQNYAPSKSLDTIGNQKITMEHDASWVEDVCSEALELLGYAKFEELNGEITLKKILSKRPVEIWPF